MGDHLNEWLLDYPQHLKDPVIKLDFRRKRGSGSKPNIPGVSKGRYSPKHPRGK